MGDKNKPIPWAKELGEALKVWCAQNGYEPGNLLGQELNVNPSTWRHIIYGDSIIGDVDPDVYARLFHRTHLRQADPRKIPVRADGRTRHWPSEYLEQWWYENHPEDLDNPDVQALLYGKNQSHAVTKSYAPHNNSGDLWLQGFANTLELLLEASPDEREAFYKKNSSLLKQVEVLAGTLNQPYDERETAISMTSQWEDKNG